MLQVLGSVSQWTEPQASAILTVLGSNLTTEYSSWSEDIVVQLRYILQHANEDLLSELPITSQVASSFSDVDFSNLQKSAIYQNFLSHNNVTVNELTSEQLVALGPLLCGSTSNDLELVLPEQISGAMKDLGQISCFNQTHYDILYSAIKESRGNESIDSAVLSTFGLIAAGMSTEDWSALAVDSMSFVDSKVFSVVDPIRIRDGLAKEQIVASGISNAGAMYKNEELYGVLSVEQQYAVLDTLGLERPEEEVEIIDDTETISSEQDTADSAEVSEETETPSSEEVTADSAGESVSIETSTLITTTTSTPIVAVKETTIEESVAETTTTEESVTETTTKESVEEVATPEEESVTETTTKDSVEEDSTGDSTTSESPEVKIIEEATTTTQDPTTTPEATTKKTDIAKILEAVKDSGFSNIVPSAIINTLLICLVAAYNM